MLGAPLSSSTVSGAFTPGNARNASLIPPAHSAARISPIANAAVLRIDPSPTSASSAAQHMESPANARKVCIFSPPFYRIMIVAPLTATSWPVISRNMAAVLNSITNIKVRMPAKSWMQSAISPSATG